MVLFVSGVCPFRCFYCPVSERRNQKDDTYANERKVRSDLDVLDEARAMDAAGTGITGGDPLHSFDRVEHYVRLLKENFGKEHHIHIYTREPNPTKIQRLAAAGLDELRMHIPHYLWGDLEGPGRSFRKVLEDAPAWGLKRGVEIPLIPDKEKELRRLLKALSSIGVDFVNLNEFEVSETNEVNLRERGYTTNPGGGWGVVGSRAVAHRLLKEEWGVPVHFCSSGFKDSVQLRQRLIRRGQKTAREFDVLTGDGTLLKGIIEVPGDGPSMAEALRYVTQKLQIAEDECYVDEERRRIEVAPALLRRCAAGLRWPAFEVEEYPTAEWLEVERSPLNPPARDALSAALPIRTAGV
jgi:hypothetical protein